MCVLILLLILLLSSLPQAQPGDDLLTPHGVAQTDLPPVEKVFRSIRERLDDSQV